MCKGTRVMFSSNSQQGHSILADDRCGGFFPGGWGGWGHVFEQLATRTHFAGSQWLWCFLSRWLGWLGLRSKTFKEDPIYFLREVAGKKRIYPSHPSHPSHPYYTLLSLLFPIILYNIRIKSYKTRSENKAKWVDCLKRVCMVSWGRETGVAGVAGVGLGSP